MNSIIVIVLSYLNLLSITDVQAENLLGLRAASYLRNILFGTAVRAEYLQENFDFGAYNEAVTNNYRLIVPEIELKPRIIWQGENQYNWDGADFLLGAPNQTGWAQQNLMLIRGHNLLWAKDANTPDWIVRNESSITPDKAKQLLSDYIHTVVSRYRGKILCWDVVNEAIDDHNNSNPFNLRDSFWLRKLGPDFIKYAFQFAHEADPDVQLYYNEYGIEATGLKATRTLNLVNWLRSEGVTIHGIGLQWHIGIWVNVTPGDAHYQSAQQFIDNRLDIMVTELDVAVPTIGAYPVNSQDLEVQGDVYRAMLNYVLHFSPNCKAILTWEFTDRYSWLPSFYNNRLGAGLPFDCLYIPKNAYSQMLDVMTHVIVDGIYRLSPQSQPSTCLGLSQNTSTNSVQLYNDSCDNDYEKWNITWQGDGTYRFSSLINNNRVLSAYNTTATIGGVDVVHWSNDVNQEWAFSGQGNGTYRIVPRSTWWRIMAVYDASDQIGIVDLQSSMPQNWILIKL